jgi:hypothetical protein
MRRFGFSQRESICYDSPLKICALERDSTEAIPDEA